jgi:hypothetical protein
MLKPAKSKLLQFGKHSIGRNVILYNEPITQVSSAKHVGIVLDTSLKTMERTLISSAWTGELAFKSYK